MAIGYYLYRALAWAVSRLPFRVLYMKSDFLFVLLYYVIGYRRKVVMENLARSFPEKSTEERAEIARSFYRNLCDIILEVIKTEGMKASQLKQRFSFSNLEIIEKMKKEGQAALIGIGHCGNWEWSGPALLMHSESDGYAIVKPLNNERFNQYMERLRAQFFEGKTIPFKMTLRYLLAMRGQPYLAVLAADQTPTRQESRFWTTFLNQETPFFEGLGKLANSLKMPVIYIDLKRTGRGRYHGDIRLITDDGSTMSPEEIMLRYVDALEDSIHAAPDNWLWSHRRWKHKREDETLHPRRFKS